MRANRLSGSEGGAGANPLFLTLSIAKMRIAGMALPILTAFE